MTGPLRHIYIPSVTYCPNSLCLTQCFPSRLTKIKVYHHHAEEVMLSALPPFKYIGYKKCNLFSSRKSQRAEKKQKEETERKNRSQCSSRKIKSEHQLCTLSKYHVRKSNIFTLSLFNTVIKSGICV